MTCEKTLKPSASCVEPWKGLIDPQWRQDWIVRLRIGCHEAVAEVAASDAQFPRVLQGVGVGWVAEGGGLAVSRILWTLRPEGLRNRYLDCQPIGMPCQGLSVRIFLLTAKRRLSQSDRSPPRIFNLSNPFSQSHHVLLELIFNLSPKSRTYICSLISRYGACS